MAVKKVIIIKTGGYKNKKSYKKGGYKKKKWRY